MTDARTIVVNGDPGWRFADLLWTHGLDLYPPSSGLSFISANPLGEAVPGNENYRQIMGNFPESFGSDQGALADEIANEVASLEHGDTKHLAILGVVSAADFEAMAEWPRKAELEKRQTAEDALTSGGRATIRALAAAMEQMSILSGDKGDVSHLAPRLWISLAVRERGYDDDAIAQTRKVAAAFGGRGAMGLRTVFFLSNGRGLDTAQHHPHQHFVKLRLAIDLLQSPHDPIIQRELRQADRSTAAAIWLRLPQGSPPYLEHSATLLSALVEAYDGLKTGRAEVDGAEQIFNEKCSELLQDIDGPLTSGTAENMLKESTNQSSDHGVGGEKASSVLGSLQVSAQNFTNSGRQPMWHNDRRILEIKNDASAFEADLAQLDEALETTSRELLREEAKKQEKRRLRVANGLVHLHSPPSQQVVSRFRAELDRQMGLFWGGIKATRPTTILSPQHSGASREAVTAAEKNKRRTLLDLLIEAEGQLLAPGIILRLFLILPAIVLLPFVVLLIGRAIDGTLPPWSWENTWDHLSWVLLFVLLPLIVLSSIIGLSQAKAMQRRSNEARRTYGRELQDSVERQLERATGHLQKDANRRRLAIATMVDSRLSISDSASVVAATDSLMDTMATTRSSLKGLGKETEPTTGQVASPALQGFRSATLRPNKVTGFLMNIGTLPDAQLTVDLPGHERHLKVVTRAASNPPRLLVSEPGRG